MKNKRKGKLELDWVDKGDIILTKFDDSGKTYPASYFHGQVSKEELMPRELELIEIVGDSRSENMLIWGENLIALRSLEKEFAGRIKLIYIDPPFNTGQDFADYEDGLDHSIWLSMMENRLELANRLLDENGFIFVHIDDNNQAYVRILWWNWGQISTFNIDGVFICDIMNHGSAIKDPISRSILSRHLPW